MNKESKWIGFRDIVLIAVLTVLCVVLQLVLAMPFSASPQLMMFVSVSLIMIVCGPIYVLMCSKACRRGTALLFSGLQAAYYLILGQAFIGLFFVLCGILSECILLGNGYSNPRRIGLSFMVYGAVYVLGSYLPYVILAEQYISNMSAMGMPQESIDAMMNLFGSPVMIFLAVLLSCACAAIGSYIGYRMRKKHFQPAGVL